MTPLRATLLLPLVAGCGQLWLEPTVDSQARGLVVGAIAPHYGPTGGGNTVTITGSGFQGDIAVRFGNAALDVAVVDEQNISVVAPDAGMEITVDVTVSSSLGEELVEGGYAFTDSTPPPDPDDSAVDIDGVGAVVEMTHLQVACTECFGMSPSDQVQVSAVAAFHEPWSGTWTGWLPTPGTCESDPAGASGPTSGYLDLGQNVHLTAGSRTITLTRTTVSGQIQYDAGALQDGDWARNAAYDLEVADGGDWGAFIVSDAVMTGSMIESISPVELLYTSSQSSFVQALSRSGSTITYSPYGGTGSFVALLGIYNEQGTTLLGTLLCREYDNGSITLPGSELSAYPPRSLVAVYMYRYQIEFTPLEVSSAYLESVVSVGVVGTASLY